LRQCLARARQRFVAHRDGADEGFTVVELLMAITLLTVLLLAVERGAIATISAATVAKERAVATSLVSGTLAQVVALPASDVAAGLNPSAESFSTDDPQYVQCVSGTCTFLLTGATLLTSNTNSSEAPLVPHISTSNIGIPYKVAIYPTTSTIANLVTVTVVVTWTSPTGGKERAVGQTQVSAP